jgi:hypothetical protein
MVVYQPRGCRCLDVTKVGRRLNIVVMPAVCVLIPPVWRL